MTVSLLRTLSLLGVIACLFVSPLASAKWITKKTVIDNFTDKADVKILLLSLATVKDQYIQVQCFQDADFQGILIVIGEFLAQSGTVSARMRFDKKTSFSDDLEVTEEKNAVFIPVQQAESLDFLKKLGNSKRFLIELTTPSEAVYEKKFRVGGFLKAYRKVENHCAPIFGKDVFQ